MGAPQRIACIGDSLTSHYAPALQDAFPADGSVQVTNLGVIGSTLLRGICGSQSWVDTAQFLSLQARKWDYVYIMLGTNDIWEDCGVQGEIECWRWPLMVLACAVVLTFFSFGVLACRAATTACADGHLGVRTSWYARVPWMPLSICAGCLVMAAAATGAICGALRSKPATWQSQWGCFDGARPGLGCRFARDYLELLRGIEGLGMAKENIYIMSPPPVLLPCSESSGRHVRSDELSSLVQRVSVAAGVRFVDLYRDFGGPALGEYRCGACLASATSNASAAWKFSCGLLQGDGVHLSRAGVQLVITRLGEGNSALEIPT